VFGHALQQLKFQQVTPPAAIVDNASAATTVIDTAGAASVLVLVSLGALDVAMTALKVQESDQSGSGFVDIAETVLGTATGTSLPTATADNTIVGFFIRCGAGRKRYLDLVATCGDGAAGTFITALAIFDRQGQTPSTAELRGLAQQVIVV